MPLVINIQNLLRFYNRIKNVFVMKIGLDTTGTSTSTTQAVAANVVTREVILNKVYPCGTIYMSTDDTNPSVSIGGVWERWSNGRTPVGLWDNGVDDEEENILNLPEKLNGTKIDLVSHNHKLNQHTHTIASHTHTMNAHNHTFNGHTHEVGTYGAGFGRVDGDSTWEGYKYTNNYANQFPKTGIYVIQHDYTFQSEGTKFDLSTQLAGKSGSTSFTTNSATSTSQASGTLTTDSPSVYTDYKDMSLSTLQPYTTCYMWKRIA